MEQELDASTLSELLHMMDIPAASAARFMAQDITHNAALAEAARREYEQQHPHLKLHPHHHHQSSGHGPGPPSGGHQSTSGELQRQQAAVEAIDADVEEESVVNREVGDLVVARLHEGRRLLEALVKVINGLLAAEAVYTSALSGVTKAVMDGPYGLRPPATAAAAAAGAAAPPASSEAVPATDGEACGEGGGPAGSSCGSDDSVQALIASFALLPDTISQAHTHLCGSLASLAADCQRLLDAVSEACRRAAQDAAHAQEGVQKGRAALLAAVAAHSDVCLGFDEILSERSRGRPRRGPDADPWATEGTVAREEKTLQQAQAIERAFLKRAFQQCQELEGRRLELSKQAVAVVSGTYRAALLPVQHDLVGLMDSAGTLDTSAQLGKLISSAQVASEIATKLSEQQARSMELVCQELFASPEILRQGEMQYLDAPFSRWTHGHFVLTRAGFLHWFRGGDQVEPLGQLNLGRCQFESGTAFCFHVMESRPVGWLTVSSRHHRYSFQAPSVDDCCEWAIAIREAIDVATGRALQCDDDAKA